MSEEPSAKTQSPPGVSPVISADEILRQSWQRQLAAAYRTAESLLEVLRLPASSLALAETSFPLLVPHSFVARMRPGDAQDPLLRQVLPTSEESASASGFVSDPVGDQLSRRVPGLLQKYHGRALLVATGACAVHCRYCFRREYPYQQDPRRMEDWEPALQELRADSSVTEVIFSGGDPLMLTDQRLSEMLAAVDRIPHVERIRFHTRLPIVLPARITDELLDQLAGLRAQVVVVVHANHGNEIVDDCADALRRLVSNGQPVLNQAVLLRGVNDDADVMETLCRRLINLGVIPYYLHQLDQVSGAAHFECEPAIGLKIIRILQSRLPGYAVPKFVQEIPGEPSKTPLV